MIYQGETLSVSYLENGIAELRFDAPGSVNKLDCATLLSLSEAIAALQQERELKGLILTSGKDAFIVGADITEFLELFDLPQDNLLGWLKRPTTSSMPSKICRFRPSPPSRDTLWAAAARPFSPPTSVWLTPQPKSACPKPNSASCRALAAQSVCRE